MKNLMRFDFDTALINSAGDPVPGTKSSVTVLFNKTVISEEEVISLIDSGEYEYDNRIIVTTPTRANNLNTKVQTKEMA